MIKLVFIGNSLNYSLTNGKIYNSSIDYALNVSFNMLVNDRGDRCPYPKYLFKTLDEVRSEKIDKILYD